jgi:hypothetical protein
MEKESINLEVRKNRIEIEPDDEGELPCGGDTEFIDNKLKSGSKTNCYKCKTNKSNYLNRNEYICR